MPSRCCIETKKNSLFVIMIRRGYNISLEKNMLNVYDMFKKDLVVYKSSIIHVIIKIKKTRIH